MEKNIEFLKNQQLVYIPPKPSKGFNVGYFLKWQALEQNKTLKFFVEGNNGPPKDEYDLTKNITQNSFVNDERFSDLMARGFDNYVILMPVFMRPIKQLENGHNRSIDYRALTSEAIWSEDKQNKRVDLQLIHMIEDAKEFLTKQKLTADEKVIIVGFSDSANFAQRFTFLHPEIVKGVFIGGMNALAPIPKDEYKNKILDYPLGTHDYKKITGHEFDFNAYNNIVQHFWLGEEDDNSILPFEECISKKERKIIETIYGKDMQTELWPSMIQSIKDCKLKNIKCYKIKDVGHNHPYWLIKPFKQEFFESLKKHEVKNTAKKSLKQESCQKVLSN